jgi:hypothetical protein
LRIILLLPIFIALLSAAEIIIPKFQHGFPVMLFEVPEKVRLFTDIQPFHNFADFQICGLCQFPCAFKPDAFQILRRSQSCFLSENGPQVRWRYSDSFSQFPKIRVCG